MASTRVYHRITSRDGLSIGSNTATPATGQLPYVRKCCRYPAKSSSTTRIALRRLAWEWNHEMPLAESWGRGMMFPEGTELTRGAKHPHDILYQMAAG